MSKVAQQHTEGNEANKKQNRPDNTQSSTGTGSESIGLNATSWTNSLSRPLSARLPLAARQNVVLRMQQTYGNSAVVRMFAQRPSRNHIQRSELGQVIAADNEDDGTGKDIQSDLASETDSQSPDAKKPNWTGIDTDNGVGGALSSVPGSRAANIFWDVAGFTPAGGAASVLVDQGETAFRGTQAAYDEVTGDTENANLRARQAASDAEGTGVDSIGMVPILGTGDSVMSLAYDLGSSDPRDSASNQVGDMIMNSEDEVVHHNEWAAKDNAAQMNENHVKLPGIPDNAVLQKVYTDSQPNIAICVVNGQQQKYVFDATKQEYVQSA